MTPSQIVSPQGASGLPNYHPDGRVGFGPLDIFCDQFSGGRASGIPHWQSLSAHFAASMCRRLYQIMRLLALSKG